MTAVVNKIKSRKRLQRRRRYAAGKCMNCGYDIRINTHRCSECGSDLASQAIEYWGEFLGKK